MCSSPDDRLPDPLDRLFAALTRVCPPASLYPRGAVATVVMAIDPEQGLPEQERSRRARQREEQRARDIAELANALDFARAHVADLADGALVAEAFRPLAASIDEALADGRLSIFPLMLDFRVVDNLRKAIETRRRHVEAEARSWRWIQGSKSQLIQSLGPTGHYSGYLEKQVALGKILLRPALRPHGWARYEMRVLDSQLHAAAEAWFATLRAGKSRQTV